MENIRLPEVHDDHPIPLKGTIKGCLQDYNIKIEKLSHVNNKPVEKINDQKEWPAYQDQSEIHQAESNQKKKKQVKN